MAYITDQEATGLTISRMILHIVGDGGGFIPQPEFPNVIHEDFFLARVRDTNAAALFSFDPQSPTKDLLQQMAAGSVSFEDGAQRLARDFDRIHPAGASRDGALFMFELDVGDQNTQLYSLVKYDYSEAIERTGSGTGPTALRRIVEAFVADRRALQKSCLIRLANGVAHAEICATDRMGRSPDLTDYFSRFLGVSRARTDEDLSRAANEALRAALGWSKELLPGQNVSQAFAAARNHLSTRLSIDDAALREAALLGAGDPQDPDARTKIERAVDRGLRQHRVSGLTFTPVRQVFARAYRKQLKTREGVTVEYPSDLENVRVHRTPNAQGGETITIETQHVEDVTPLRDRAR